MDAALSGTTVVIEDTSDSPTYTDFGRAAYRKGITRTMSIGLPAQRRTVGALNVYATDGGAFDQTAQELALTFAGYAAVALANAGLYASTSQLAANLQRALESRAIIDQAKGILMARHGVSADEAFDMISRQSQLTNRKVRDIAAELAADAGRGRRD
jgi:GAF domain-containing protein